MDDAPGRDIWFQYFHKNYRLFRYFYKKASVKKFQDTKVPSYAVFHEVVVKWSQYAVQMQTKIFLGKY